MIRPRLFVEVPHVCLIPRGYGVAWRCWDRDSAVCMPVPLNWLGHWLRQLWLTLKYGVARAPESPAEAYAMGRRDEAERWAGYVRDIGARVPKGWNGS